MIIVIIHVIKGFKLFSQTSFTSSLPFTPALMQAFVSNESCLVARVGQLLGLPADPFVCYPATFMCYS